MQDFRRLRFVRLARAYCRLGGLPPSIYRLCAGRSDLGLEAGASASLEKEGICLGSLVVVKHAGIPSGELIPTVSGSLYVEKRGQYIEPTATHSSKRPVISRSFVAKHRNPAVEVFSNHRRCPAVPTA